MWFVSSGLPLALMLVSLGWIMYRGPIRWLEETYRDEAPALQRDADIERIIETLRDDRWLSPLPDDREAVLWAEGSSAFWLHPQRWDNVPYNKRTGRLEPFWMHLPPASSELARALRASEPPADHLRLFLIGEDAAPIMPCGCPRSPPGVSFEGRARQAWGWSTCLSCGGQWVARGNAVFESVHS